MAVTQVLIEKDNHRASIVGSSLPVWVAQGWKLVTESDQSAEPTPDPDEPAAQPEADEADAEERARKPAPPEPVTPAAKPVGAHQAPEPPKQEAQHG